MGFREKIGYIIEYYGFMILALFLMLIAGIFLVSGLFGEDKDAGMSVVAVNQNYSEDTIKLWENTFNEAYGENPVEFDPYYRVDLGGFADDMEQGYLMKLSANLFAGEIDMMILDEVSYRHFSDLGALKDLRPLILEIQSGESLMLPAGEENMKETWGLILPEYLDQESSGTTYLVIPKSSDNEYSYPELFRAIYAS